MRWTAIGGLLVLAVAPGAGSEAAPLSRRNLVQHVDLDRDGRTELVQVTRGRAGLRVVDARGAFDFPLPAPALDVSVADWVPGGALELVVATPRGVLVYAVDGVLLAAEVAPLEDALLVPLTGLDGLAEVVLVARLDGRVDLSAFLLRRAGSTSLGALSPGRNALVEDPLGGPLFALVFRGEDAFEARAPRHGGPIARTLRLPLVQASPAHARGLPARR